MPVEAKIIAIHVKPEVAAARGTVGQDLLVVRDRELPGRRARFSQGEIGRVAETLQHEGLTVRDVTFFEGKTTFPSEGEQATTIPYQREERQIRGFFIGRVESARVILQGKAALQSRQGLARLAGELHQGAVQTEARHHEDLASGGYVIKGSTVHTLGLHFLMAGTHEELGTELQLAGMVGSRHVDSALSYLGRHKIDVNPAAKPSAEGRQTMAHLITFGAAIPFVGELTVAGSDLSALANTVNPDATLREKGIRWGVAVIADALQVGNDAATATGVGALVGIPGSVLTAWLSNPVYISAAFERMADRKHILFARTLGAAIQRGEQYNISPFVRRNLATNTVRFLRQSGYYEKSVRILQEPAPTSALGRVRLEHAQLFVALYQEATAFLQREQQGQLPPAPH